MLDTTKNRAMAELIFDHMIGIGFVPYDIEYGTGYFIFNFGEDSVVHFRVKGVSRHWKFGLWIHSGHIEMVKSQGDEPDYNLKAAELFVQWDTQIDKFKPSASDILVEFSAVSWMNHERGEYEYFFAEMDQMLRTLRRHPFMAYAGAFAGYRHFFDGSYIWHFIKSEWQAADFAAKEWFSRLFWVPYTTFKCFIASRTKGVAEIKVIDFEKENPGWLTTYAYEILITFPSYTTDEQDNVWLDFWFRHDSYGCYRNGFDLYKLSPTLKKEGVEGERGFYRED